MHQGANQQEMCYQTAQSQISQTIVPLESFCLTARELVIHCGFYWHIRDQFVSSDFWNAIHTCSKISGESVGIDEGSLSRLELRTWWEGCWIIFWIPSPGCCVMVLFHSFTGKLSREDCLLHVCETSIFRSSDWLGTILFGYLKHVGHMLCFILVRFLHPSPISQASHTAYNAGNHICCRVERLLLHNLSIVF